MDLLALPRRGELYRRASAGLLVAVVAVLALTAAANAAPPIDLGTLPGFTVTHAIAVNASGQVVGDAYTSSGEERPFSWTQAGGMVDLGTLPGFAGGDTEAVAVNASGEVVGTACAKRGCEEGSRAFSWTKAGGMVDLGTLPGFPNAEATAVNASGEVVGTAKMADNAVPYRAFIWTQASGMVELEPLYPGDEGSGARAINDSGQVVGWADKDAALWNTTPWTRAGPVVDLGKLEGSEYADATAINESGQVVGVSRHTELHQAFSWTQAGGMVALGTEVISDHGDEAIAVNASGQVIGTFYGEAEKPQSSFSWTQGGGLVELGGGHFAAAINDSGQVVGEARGGFNDGERHAFSWTQAGGFVELEPLPGEGASASAINDSGQVVGSSGDYAVLWNSATESVSVASTTVVVDRRGEATIMLTCTGSAPTCGGTLTLTAEGTIGRGRNRHSSTVTIGTISGSIPSGETTTVALQLNAAGHTLLSEAHRSLSGSLTILKSSPAPSEERTEAVYLVQQ